MTGKCPEENLITVDVREGDVELASRQFHPQKARGVMKALEKRFGAGELHHGGVTITEDEDVPAGHYIYHLTGLTIHIKLDGEPLPRHVKEYRTHVDLMALAEEHNMQLQGVAVQPQSRTTEPDRYEPVEEHEVLVRPEEALWIVATTRKKAAAQPRAVFGGFAGLHAAMAAVGRLSSQGTPIGSCAVVEPGFVLTCRHCIVEDGRCLPNLTAFSKPLQFYAASPQLDVALFTFGKSQQNSTPAATLPPQEQSTHEQASSQPSPQLAQPLLCFGAEPRVGEQVRLLSYPRAVENTRAAQQPVASQGTVTVVGTFGSFMGADYSACMSNSSGGAVVNEFGHLVGIHTCACYHRAHACGRVSPPGCTGSSSSSSSSTTTTTTSEIPFRIERNPLKLWSPAEDGVLQPTTDVMAQEALDYVEHKAFLSVFVTGSAIARFVGAVAATKDELQISAERQARRALLRNGKKRAHSQSKQ